MAQITVLAPDYEGARTTDIQLAPRAQVHDGAVVTVIENGKPNAKRLLSLLAEALQERLPVARIDVHSKPSAGKPIDADEAQMLAARSHLIISGVGD